MNEQGYTLRSEVPFLPLAAQNRFQVRKSDGTRYVVNLYHRTCNCPFYGDNQQFKTCKHLLWADAEKEDMGRAEAAAAVYADEQANAELRRDDLIEASIKQAR